MKPSLRSKGFFGRPRRSRPAPCCPWLSHSASRLIQLVGRVDQDSHCEDRASSWSSSIVAAFRFAGGTAGLANLDGLVHRPSLKIRFLHSGSSFTIEPTPSGRK